MKVLSFFLIALLASVPADAEQALVLTEIEQMQEKIWYLQRDVAAQKTILEQHQKQLKDAGTTARETHDAVDHKLDEMADMLKVQVEKNLQMEKNIQSLEENIAALLNEFNQQNAAQLQQAEKSGTQEGLLQVLRDEVAANRARTEMAIADTEKKLTEVRTQLAAMQEKKEGRLDKVGLYLGGSALLLAILLTVAFAIFNSKSNSSLRKRNGHSEHEL